MERVNLVGNIPSNVVSNVVPEPGNRREANNRQQQPRAEEVEGVVVSIRRVTQEEERGLENVASTYEKIGDTYEKVEREQSAITAYQTSYTLNPNPEVVQKIDDLAARISSEGKI